MEKNIKILHILTYYLWVHISYFAFVASMTKLKCIVSPLLLSPVLKKTLRDDLEISELLW